MRVPGTTLRQRYVFSYYTRSEGEQSITHPSLPADVATNIFCTLKKTIIPMNTMLAELHNASCFRASFDLSCETENPVLQKKVGV